MGYTIYEINPADLPRNVSITITPQLEELVREEAYEAPVRKKHSLKHRIAAAALAVLLAAMPAMYGCDGNGNNGNGDAISPVASSYNVGSNITPANGTGVGPDDDPLEVGVDTPALVPECSADPECAAEAASGLDVVIDVTYDNGTSDTGDDETVTVANHTGVPFGSYTSGDVDLSAAHGGAGLSDGEGIEAHVALTFTDSKGESHTIEGSVNYTYEEGSNPNEPSINCRVATAVAGLGFYIGCSGNSPLGYDLFGNWSSAITDSDGHPLIGPVIDEEGNISGLIPGAEHVEMYNLHVEVHDGHGNTGTYDNIFYIDRNETTATVNDTEVTDIPEYLADDIATNCGSGLFNPALKSTPGGYRFEITRAANGDSAMTCVWDRIQNMDANVSANMSATTTMYTPTGETFEEFVSGEPDSIQFVYEDQL